MQSDMQITIMYLPALCHPNDNLFEGFLVPSHKANKLIMKLPKSDNK